MSPSCLLSNNDGKALATIVTRTPPLIVLYWLLLHNQASLIYAGIIVNAFFLFYVEYLPHLRPAALNVIITLQTMTRSLLIAVACMVFTGNVAFFKYGTLSNVELLTLSTMVFFIVCYD